MQHNNQYIKYTTSDTIKNLYVGTHQQKGAVTNIQIKTFRGGLYMCIIMFDHLQLREFKTA